MEIEIKKTKKISKNKILTRINILKCKKRRRKARKAPILVKNEMETE